MNETCGQSLPEAPTTKAKGQSWLVGVASLIMAFGLAACGGSSTGANSNTGGKQATNAAPTTQCTIPQNNGGDHDADNNGAPSDGDGCDK